MCEKAISIALYVAASGIFTVLGESFPVMGSPKMRSYLTEGMEDDFGGKLAFQRDPVEAAGLMIDHINSKRDALGLSEMMYEGEEAAETEAETEEAAAATGGS